MFWHIRPGHSQVLGHFPDLLFVLVASATDEPPSLWEPAVMEVSVWVGRDPFSPAVPDYFRLL
jgi:hypothetical protein